MAQELTIIMDDRICGGNPVIKGTRMPVSLLLLWLQNGETPERIKEFYGRDDYDTALEILHQITEYVKIADRADNSEDYDEMLEMVKKARKRVQEL